MTSLYLFLSVFLTFSLQSSLVRCDDDEDVKGPLMFKNKDGSLMSTSQQIEAQKYKAETHSVTTDDGYVLTLFRIVPAKLPASVVLLQHGNLCSSDCWVTDNSSLAFTLSDAGYDVWLNNVRGNFYSRKHTKLDPDKDKSFWNFSWHEMGTKDTPAVIDHILKTTKQEKLHYVGHSMGTNVAFVMAALKPEYDKKLKCLVAFGPTTTMTKATEMVGPDGMVEEMANKYMEQFKSADKWEVFPRSDIPPNNKTQITCDDVEENFRDMCKDKMESAHEILGGPYVPCGQSWKTMVHLHQMITAGMMKYFNYGTPEENEKVYGSKEPPSYAEHFKNISAPVILWSSENDGAVMPKDVDDLKALLPNVIADNRIPDECFDHMAFTFPRKVACWPIREKLYKNLIEAFKKLD